MAKRWVLADGMKAERVDRFLARTLGVGRAQVKAMLEAEQIHVNGIPVRKSYLLGGGDVVAVLEDPPAKSWLPRPEPEAPLAVVEARAALLVVDKPPGQPCHPISPDETGTLCNALLGHYPELARVGYRAQEPGLLHRLDNGTSGLLVVARSQPAFLALRRSLKAGVWNKHYLALVHGRPALGLHRGTIGKQKGHRARAEVVPGASGDGERAVQMEVLSAEPYGRDLYLAEVSCARAARHQLRAHFAALGHPLVGDVLYGGPALLGRPLPHHFLHACRIAFPLPDGGGTLDVSQPLPKERLAVLRALAGETREA